MGPPFPLKIAPFHEGSGLLYNTWFPEPNRVLNLNGISIGSALFAGLTSVTDRQTDDTARSVATDRIYVRSSGDQA